MYYNFKNLYFPMLESGNYASEKCFAQKQRESTRKGFVWQAKAIFVSFVGVAV